MRALLFIILLPFSSILFAQIPVNLDFEETAGNDPVQWEYFGEVGEYEVAGSDLAHGGKRSATIKHVAGEDGFRAWSNRVAVRITGKKVKLTGWLKTENVSDGFAGLWMRIDPQAGFDNMEDKALTGTRDWTKFEIELDLEDEKAEFIVFGGLLVGKGQIWIDDLELTVDGKPYAEAPRRAKAPAALDTAFDAGSGIVFPALTPELTRDLVTLGKVWGFMKYHHQDIAAGEYNWDYELFRFLPRFLASGNRASELSGWVKEYDRGKPCTDCVEKPEDAEVAVDFRWLAEPAVNEELRDYVNSYRDNRDRISKHYYIGSVGFTGNPDFKHEDAYADMGLPDAGFRYLAAVRLWNMVQYFFPYRAETDTDWNEVLANHLPAFLAADTEYAYERVLTLMIADIQDSHAGLWRGNGAIQDKRGENIPPFRATFVEGELTVVDYYDPKRTVDEIAPGDVITRINNQSVSDYIKTESPWFPASNPSARLRDIGETILRTPEATTALTVRRDGKTRVVNVPVQSISATKGYYRWFRRGAETPSYRMLDGNIGYLTLANVTSADYAAAKEAFADARGIVIDIRNYPSAFGPFAFGGFLMNSEENFVKFTSMDLNNPGYFSYGEPLTIEADEKTFKGKVVVLVNELSQSQAEYTTMAFQAGNNVTVIGSQTAGADGNISRIDLPGGRRTMISGLGVFYPDGRKTQRIGIVPDIEVKPTQAGVRAGRDELLERAILEIGKDE